MKNEGNVEAFKRVELWFVRSTKNVGAILVIALYSVIALLLMRQFVNCLYGVVGALGCVRDRSGYETQNQLRITNYELRKGKN